VAELSWDSPTSWGLRWSRTLSAVALMAAPIVAFVAGWLAHRAPWSLITSPHCQPATWAVVASLGVAIVAYGWYVILGRTSGAGVDTELVFGTATVALALLAAASAASALFPWLPLADAEMHNSGPSRFFWVAAFLAIALVFIAHDWTRRYLMVAATVAIIALGALVVRAGYEDPGIPDKHTRNAIVTKAEAQQEQLEKADNRAVGKVKAAAAAARQTLQTELRGRPRPAVTAELRAAARAIAATTDKAPVNGGLVEAFDAERLHEPDSDEPAATKLNADVHAFVDAQAAAAAAAPQSNEKGLLKTAVRKASNAADSGVHWQQAADDLALQLAQYRAAVTGSPEDEAAYRVLLAAQPTTKHVSLLDALTDGPQALWTAATDAGARPLVPGPLGWVLLGALVLWFWTLLLKMNARQLAGPVNMPTETANPRDLTVLRVAVLSNIEEPGTTPGAGVSNPVTDLMDIAGGPAISTIEKVLNLALKIAGRQYGYDLTVDVVAPKSDAGEAKDSEAKTAPTGPVTVLVRVRTISNSETIATHALIGADAEKAVRAAGLWAAGFVLNRSSRIPSWAEWEPDTAAALASTQDENATLADFEEAVRQAPRSGLLLVKAGHQYELANHPGKAIALYARAVTAHPSYRVARYRLGAALTTIADAGNRAWPEMKAGDRESMLRGVQAAASALHLDITSYLPFTADEAPLPSTQGPSVKENLNNVGRCVLEQLLVENRLHHRLVLSLRRSERDTSLPSPRAGAVTPPRRLHRIIYSAFLASRWPTPDADKLIKYASKPRQYWQASYNAACGLATMGEAEKALTMLEQALTQRGIQQLDAKWVCSDPDLASLQDNARFDAFAEQLRGGR
jgi:tetratricopeptide (TPR) repeat protein